MHLGRTMLPRASLLLPVLAAGLLLAAPAAAGDTASITIPAIDTTRPEPLPGEADKIEPPEPPEELDYEAGYRIPPGYHVESKVRTWAIGTGAGIFAATYGSSVLMGWASQKMSESGSTDGAALYIPIAGPFIFLNKRGSRNPEEVALFALSGVAQAAGLGLIVFGIASRSTSLMRDDVAASRLVVTPAPLGHSGLGLVIAGTM